MRKLIASHLSAALLVGSALLAGCASAPPPQPSAPPPPPPAAAVAPEAAPPPATPPAPPPGRHHRERSTEFKHEGSHLKLPGMVEFETGSDKLSPVSDDVLEHVHDYLDAKPELSLLRIEGHTDNEGRAADNQTLSEKRAVAVARWLVGVGVDCKRLLPVGFGQTKPIVPNDSPEDKAKNRRVDFVDAAFHGKAVGGPLDGGGKPAGDPCH